jgi:hypothetical protein
MPIKGCENWVVKLTTKPNSAEKLKIMEKLTSEMIPPIIQVA